MKDLRDGALVDLTPAEIAEVETRQAQAIAAANRTQAMAELRLKDRVVNRCAEKGVEVPEAWATYADELRAILASGDALPERPEFPAGT